MVTDNIHKYKNERLFAEILSVVSSAKQYGRELRVHHQEAYAYLLECTQFLDVQNPQLRARFACLLNGVSEIPLCKNCKSKCVNLANWRPQNPIPSYCSKHCMRTCPEAHQKQMETMLQDYGVKYALQNKDLLKKARSTYTATCQDRYGVDCVLSLPEVQAKKEATNLATYGVKCTLQAPKVKEKSQETLLDLYGVDHPSKSPELYAKSRAACKELYGDEHPIRTQQVKAKLNETNMESYGVEWTFQAQSVKDKSRERCQEKYGCDYALQAPEVQAKCRSTLWRNYHVTHNMQIPEVRSSSKKHYQFDNKQFDSAPELAFYIWLKDNNIEFEYQPGVSFEYEHDGKTHFYYPDFKIDDLLFELKGLQFFEDKDPTKRMICPWDRSQDALYEAKHQCMLANNVVILTTSQYEMFILYVKSRYGTGYLKQFKSNVITSQTI